MFSIFKRCITTAKVNNKSMREDTSMKSSNINNINNNNINNIINNNDEKTRNLIGAIVSLVLKRSFDDENRAFVVNELFELSTNFQRSNPATIGDLIEICKTCAGETSGMSLALGAILNQLMSRVDFVQKMKHKRDEFDVEKIFVSDETALIFRICGYHFRERSEQILRICDDLISFSMEQRNEGRDYYVLRNPFFLKDSENGFSFTGFTYGNIDQMFSGKGIVSSFLLECSKECFRGFPNLCNCLPCSVEREKVETDDKGIGERLRKFLQIVMVCSRRSNPERILRFLEIFSGKIPREVALSKLVEVTRTVSKDFEDFVPDFPKHRCLIFLSVLEDLNSDVEAGTEIWKSFGDCGRVCVEDVCRFIVCICSGIRLRFDLETPMQTFVEAENQTAPLFRMIKISEIFQRCSSCMRRSDVCKECEKPKKVPVFFRTFEEFEKFCSEDRCVAKLRIVDCKCSRCLNQDSEEEIDHQTRCGDPRCENPFHRHADDEDDFEDHFDEPQDGDQDPTIKRGN